MLCFTSSQKVPFQCWAKCRRLKRTVIILVRYLTNKRSDWKKDNFKITSTAFDCLGSDSTRDALSYVATPCEMATDMI